MTEEIHRVLREVSVALARVEEKVDAARSDRVEDREYLLSIGKRVSKIERRGIWRAGWVAGVAAVVAAIVAPLVGLLKGFWS